MKAARSVQGLLLLAALAAVLVACDDFLLRTLMEGENGSAWAGTLQISPASITLAQAADITFTAKGGSGSYTFSIVGPIGGSSIAAATGHYVASATATGTETVRVTDSSGGTSNALVTVTPAAGTIPDYAVVSATYPAAPFIAGENFSGSFQIQETSGNPGGSSITARVYLSGNTIPDAGDQVLFSQTLAALAGSGISAVQSYSGQWPASGGGYYLLIEVAAGDDIDASDNVANSGLITVSSAAPPNYDVTSLAPATPITVSPGGTISQSLTFDNIGAGNGTASLYWEVYLDMNGNSVIDAADRLLASGIEAAMSAAAAPITRGFGGTWPAAAGTYRLIARLTAADDSNAADNEEVSAAITVQAPDYVIDSVSNSGGTTAGGPIAGQFTYRNSAPVGNGSQPVFWRAYYSTLNALDGTSEVLIDSGSAAARNAGASAVVSFDGTWPSTAGSYHLIVELGASDETDAAEQASTGPFALSSAPLPDVNYVVQTVANTGTLTGGSAITGEFTYRNTGTANGTQIIYWSAYYSTATTLNGTNEVLIATGTASALLAGATSAVPVPFTGSTWPAAGGSFYLIVKVGASDSATTDEGPSGSLVVSPVASPNYDVTQLTPTSATTVSVGGSIGQTVTFDNVGAGDGVASLTWEVYLDMNGNSVIDSGTDLLLAAGVEAGMSAAAAPITRSVGGNWPSTPGTYRLIARLSASDDGNAADNLEVSAAVTTQAPDYVIDSVSNSGGSTAGGPIDGQFLYRNAALIGNGSQPVYWRAYRSTLSTLDGSTEVLIDSGTASKRDAATAAVPVLFEGSWPPIAGTYYLIVELSASDESDPAEQAFAGPISLPAVDYNVIAVSDPANSVVGGSVTGSFTIRNDASAGSAPIQWYVYASTDNVYDGADVLIASGTAGALASGATTSPLYYGTWPGPAGSYFIIARVTAADNPVPGVGSSAVPAVVSAGPPDYTGSFDATVPYVAVLGSTMASASCRITVTNTTANTGIRPVTWRVYRSTDKVLDAADVLLDSAAVAPFGPNESRNFDFAAGPVTTWPSTAGFYYLIASINAEDDADPVNDVKVSWSIAVATYAYTSSGALEPNNNFPITAGYEAVGFTLAAGTSIAIEGKMDATAGERDTYQVKNGPGVSSVYLGLRWNTGLDDCDLWLYDESFALLGQLQGIFPDAEPGANPQGYTGFSGNKNHYYSVYFYLNGGTSPSGTNGERYALFLRAP